MRGKGSASYRGRSIDGTTVPVLVLDARVSERTPREVSLGSVEPLYGLLNHILQRESTQDHDTKP